MNTLILSENQETIKETWTKENCNVLIQAVAGSGKTSTLLMLLEYCDSKTLILAFNKSVQQEIEEKITQRGLGQGKVLTLHALGMMAIRNSYRLKVNTGKNYDIMKKLRASESRILNLLSWKDKMAMNYTLMDMNDTSRLFMTNDTEAIKSHMESMGKRCMSHPQLATLWSRIIEIRESYMDKRILEVDFIDMLYIPVLKNLSIPLDPTYLMIDEAQDLSFIQHKLVENLIKQGDVKKWIAVGDQNQSIYAFSGAFSSSFQVFKDMDNVKELPLDICYRCSTNIIASANEVYNVMKPYSENEGVVEITTTAEFIKDESMVICRNKAPLFSLYFYLLSIDKRCHIKGEEILASLLRFLKGYGNTSVGGAREEMNREYFKLKEDTSENARFKLYVFEENYEIFIKISESLCKGSDRMSVLTEKLKHLFEDKDNSIMLCTIHKSKGLESDVVYILNENLIPSKFAKSSVQLVQEENLRYVARTRAKKELYFLNLKQ